VTPDPFSIAVGSGAILAVDAAREFARRIGGRLGDGVGEFIQGYATHRLRNVLSQFERARVMVREAGAEVGPVPPRMLVRWMEHASVEDEVSLSEKWAALLANASIGAGDEDAPQIHVSILAELTPRAAGVLEMIRDTTPMRGDEPTTVRDGKSATADLILHELGPAAVSFGSNGGQRRERLDATLDLLVRQGVATRSMRFDYAHPSPLDQLGRNSFVPPPARLEVDGTEIRITELGKSFLAACSPPPKSEAAAE